MEDPELVSTVEVVAWTIEQYRQDKAKGLPVPSADELLDEIAQAVCS